MNLKAWRLLFCFILFFETGCQSQSPVAQEATSSDESVLAQEVNALLVDAEIASDPLYQKLNRNAQAEQSIGPADLRSLLESWEGSIVLRDWPADLTLRCQQQCLNLSWTGEIANAFDSADAIKRFDNAMEDRGYRTVTDEFSIEKLGERIGLTAAEIDRWSISKNYHGYTRKSGDTEQIVFADAAGFTGSKEIQSGVKYWWFVSRSYPHPQPTLNEALTAMPRWFQVEYLDPSFYEALSEDIISNCRTGDGTTIEFTENESNKVIAALEKNGFEYRGEKEPLIGIQRTWYRYADATYAHVTTFPDSKRVRFFCQKPQHEGEPRTGKPAPLHPSLLLPPSKRPVVELSQLNFATPDLKARAELFHRFADETAADDWLVQRYKDTRYSAVARYTGLWQTSKVTSASSFRKNSLPYQEFSVLLEGSGTIDDSDLITKVSMGGRYVPKRGWAAGVNLHSNGTCWAVVGLVTDKNSNFSFDVNRSKQVISISQNSVKANFRESSAFTYEYEARLPYEATLEAEAKRREHIISMFESPETLRDAMLDDIETLRQLATRDIARPGVITATDWSNVRSDNPPRPLPNSGDPPSEAIQQKLLAEIRSQLDARENLVRENNQQMHAALKKAFPLDLSKLQ